MNWDRKILAIGYVSLYDLAMALADFDLQPKITVIVAEKRHHIRFFPPAGNNRDKNGNPLPGTLVEHDVTHPWENDIYLCSHVAIQGTARPTHYHMLMDEANLPVEKFQTLLYEHCYQYQRATTPVSLCKSQCSSSAGYLR